MKKAMLSVIVIVCTVVCVLIMLFSDKINVKQKSFNNKIEVINSNQNTDIRKEDTEILKQDSSTEKNETKSQDKKLSNTDEKKSYIAGDTYRKLKMDEINNEMEHDKKVFFEQNNKTVNNKEDANKRNSKKEATEDNNQINSENTENNYSKDSVPVFKVSKSEIKDNLTLLDKEKLLAIAAKLSAVDYEKINKYLESGSDEDIRNTIKLLKCRLSDKDYEKVRMVVEKFINMDAVEQ